MVQDGSLAAALAIALALAESGVAVAADDTAYLFTSFRGNGQDGLHLAYSRDGREWTDLKRVFLKPRAGKSKLMRDPCLRRAPDGTFHMVWSAGWWERGFGYAHSRDLIHWSEQRYVEVMAHEPFTTDWVEGPSAIQIGDEWLVYFDHYASPHYYGAVKTRDFQTWTDVSKQMRFPPGHRHGTVLRVPQDVLGALKKHASE